MYIIINKGKIEKVAAHDAKVNVGASDCQLASSRYKRKFAHWNMVT